MTTETITASRITFKKIRAGKETIGDHSCCVKISGRYAVLIDGRMVATIENSVALKYRDIPQWRVFSMTGERLSMDYETLAKAKALITRKILSGKVS